MPPSNTPAILGMIWAQGRRGVIGANGSVPWDLPEDRAHFESVTMGHPVVMGRRTWDSLAAENRPLAGRTNYVITRNDDWHPSGAIVVRSLDHALDAIGDQEAWIIGGAQIFSEAVGRANLAVVTEINHSYHGEAYAPGLGSEWVIEAAEPPKGWSVGSNRTEFRIVTYRKP
jgi:dihydrofolate reductase